MEYWKKGRRTGKSRSCKSLKAGKALDSAVTGFFCLINVPKPSSVSSCKQTYLLLSAQRHVLSLSVKAKQNHKKSLANEPTRITHFLLQTSSGRNQDDLTASSDEGVTWFPHKAAARVVIRFCTFAFIIRDINIFYNHHTKCTQRFAGFFSKEINIIKRTHSCIHKYGVRDTVSKSSAFNGKLWLLMNSKQNKNWNHNAWGSSTGIRFSWKLLLACFK